MATIKRKKPAYDYDHPSHKPADLDFRQDQRKLAQALKRGRELNELERLGDKCDDCGQRDLSTSAYGSRMLCYDCSNSFMMRD